MLSATGLPRTRRSRDRPGRHSRGILHSQTALQHHLSLAVGIYCHHYWGLSLLAQCDCGRPSSSEGSFPHTGGSSTMVTFSRQQSLVCLKSKRRYYREGQRLECLPDTWKSPLISCKDLQHMARYACSPADSQRRRVNAFEEVPC